MLYTLYNYRISGEGAIWCNMDERVTYKLLIIVRLRRAMGNNDTLLQFNDHLNVSLCEIMVARKKRKKRIKYVSI